MAGSGGPNLVAIPDEPKPVTPMLTLPVTIGAIKLDIALLPKMSLRVARLHAIDQIAKALKGNALTDALKALGCK